MVHSPKIRTQNKKENTCNPGIFCRIKPHFRVTWNGLQTSERCASFPDLFPLVDPDPDVREHSADLACGYFVADLCTRKKEKTVNFTRINCTRIGRPSVQSSRNIRIRCKRVILPGAIRITVYSSGAPPDLVRHMNIAPVTIICTNGDGRPVLCTRPLFLMKFAR